MQCTHVREVLRSRGDGSPSAVMELASLTDLVDLDFGGRSPRAPFGEGTSSDFFFFNEALRRKDMVGEGG